MPTITQLPAATSVAPADAMPISQGGTTRAVLVGDLLASTQPAITIQSPSLLGRTSLGSGTPEQVSAGAGLNLSDGVLSANGSDHASFPAATSLTSDAALVISQQGNPMLLPVSMLRGLFSAGQNVTISPSGTISAAVGAGSSGGTGFGSAIGALSVVGAVSAQDLVPVSHAGLDCAISYGNLINGVTIDQASIAMAVNDSDTMWVAQGTNMMASQTFTAIWAWIAGKLLTFKMPVVEVIASTNLEAAVHNGRLLICSQPVTLTPLVANMRNGFRCTILNVSSGNVVLGSGVTTSTGSSTLAPGQSAEVICASYSGGVITFASMPGVAAATVMPPGQVSTLAVTAATASSITLSWQPPTTGAAASSYTVQYRVSGSSMWTATSPIVGTTTYQITGLQAGTAYDVTIQANNASASGPVSAVLTSSTVTAV